MWEFPIIYDLAKLNIAQDYNKEIILTQIHKYPFSS